MTGDVPWFKFHSREWLARTGGLSPSDKGILTDLLAIMHERGEPVPFNEKVLAARCRATPKTFMNAVKTLTQADMIHFEEDAIWSGTMQRQIEFEIEKSLSRKTAAEKRWKKTKGNQSSSDANAMLYKRKEEDKEGAAPSGQTPNTEFSDKAAEGATEAEEVAPSSAPEGAEGALIRANELHIYEPDDVAERIDCGDDDDIIVAHDFARSYLEVHLSDYLPDHICERLVGFLKEGKLTVGLVRESINRERENAR
ncbi:DUF1376 domain-containing protein [Rhizobium ruizarguesonis]